MAAIRCRVLLCCVASTRRKYPVFGAGYFVDGFNKDRADRRDPGDNEDDPHLRRCPGVQGGQLKVISELVVRWLSSLVLIAVKTAALHGISLKYIIEASDLTRLQSLSFC